MSAASCRGCASYRRIIRAEIRLNENRLRRGESIDLSVIEQAKADLAECKQRGHVGPAWQRGSAAHSTA